MAATFYKDAGYLICRVTENKMELSFGSVSRYIGQNNLLQSRENQILKNSLRVQAYCHEEIQLKLWRYAFKIKADWSDFTTGN